jgi:hypothetical protein
MRVEGVPRQENREGDAPMVREATTPEEIREFLAFGDAILEVNWGPEGPPEEYTPEYIAAHPDFTKIFIAKDADGRLMGGAKVKMIDERTRHRLGLDVGEYAHQIGVLFEYEVVREDERRKGLLKPLTEPRVEWAKKRNATYLCAEIAVTTPVSGFIKAEHQGFRYIGIKEPGEGITDPYFVIVKDIAEHSPTPQNKPANIERKEVAVNEHALDVFQPLFADGWVGVGATLSSDEKSWSLLLEKQDT